MTEYSTANTAAKTYISDAESAKRLVKGIASINQVVLFSKGPLDGSADEHDQLLHDMLSALQIDFKLVDVSRDVSMHLGLPAKYGEPITPYIYIDGLPVGDVKTSLDMLKSGELFTWFDRGNVPYDKDVAAALQKA